MPAIDRGLDSSELPPRRPARCAAPAPARDRRPRPDRAVGLARARARDLVGAGSVAQPRHRRAGAQPAGHARRHRRRPADAAARHGGARAGPAGRRLGLAPRHPSAVAARAHAPRVLDRSPCCWPRPFASCLPRSAAWPLPTGLGGVIGDCAAAAAGPAPRRTAFRAGARRRRRRRRRGTLVCLAIAAGFGWQSR